MTKTMLLPALLALALAGAARAQSLATSDLNGDGRDELVFYDANSGRYGAAFMHSNGYVIANSAELFAGDTDIERWLLIGPR